MNYRAFFILYKYINQSVYLFILFMHTKSETMAALTPSKLPKMLKVIDIDIEIMGVVNFTFSSPLFIYDGSFTVLFRSVTRT